MSPADQHDASQRSKHTLVLHVDIDNTILDAWDSEVLASAFWGRWPWSSTSNGIEGFLAPAKPHDRVGRLAALRLWELINADAPSLVPPESGLVSFYDACLSLGSNMRRDEKRRWAEETRQLCKAFIRERAGTLDSDFLRQVPESFYGRKYIAPSFFRLVEHLEASDRNFRIIFRTFGNNVAAAVREWNLFCSGRHPLAKGPAPPERLRRKVALPEGTGRWFRDGQGPLLALAGPNRGQYCHDDGCISCEAAGEAKDAEVLLLQLHGVQEKDALAKERKCWQAMMEVLGFEGAATQAPQDDGQNSGLLTLCLRECCEWWKAEARQGHAGKLFMLDPAILESRVDTIFLNGLPRQDHGKQDGPADSFPLGLDLSEPRACGRMVLAIIPGPVQAWNSLKANASQRVKVGDWIAEVDGKSCCSDTATTDATMHVRPCGVQLKIRRGLLGTMHHIFFDDFARDGSDGQACSILARNAASGDSLAVEELQGKFLVRVKPFEVLQPDYFIKAVNSCEESVQRLLSVPCSNSAPEWVRKKRLAPAGGSGQPFVPLAPPRQGGPWRRVPLSKPPALRSSARPFLGGSLQPLLPANCINSAAADSEAAWQDEEESA
mmetsp:Transcript_76383/g.181665  ORF Transcript_76383/g.181665 Transcript_76383/m.181665 type:complete len:607 (-) Transcript_76383:40-1860(-)